jgi:hypothetical protein|tara:strand:+ start:167 stop:412 length:246 start_codon:yes stop_codon:yes gene_type:complete
MARTVDIGNSVIMVCTMDYRTAKEAAVEMSLKYTPDLYIPVEVKNNKWAIGYFNADQELTLVKAPGYKSRVKYNREKTPLR